MESSSQGAGSLSIEETNKLRAKLGMKPLEVGTSEASTSVSKDGGKKKDDLGEFYHKPAENWADKAEREKLRTKLAEHKEKRQLHHRLSKVKGLGDSDSEEDVGNWVDKNRKIAKAKLEAQKRVIFIIGVIIGHLIDGVFTRQRCWRSWTPNLA